MGKVARGSPQGKSRSQPVAQHVQARRTVRLGVGNATIGRKRTTTQVVVESLPHPVVALIVLGSLVSFLLRAEIVTNRRRRGTTRPVQQKTAMCRRGSARSEATSGVRRQCQMLTLA